MSKNFFSNRKKVQEVLTKAEKRALEAAGLFAEGEAIVRTPVDTGNLRSSITHQVDEQEKSVIIGTNVEYAPFVEKGTSRMTAQPYLTPAVEENRDRIKKLMQSELMKLD